MIQNYRNGGHRRKKKVYHRNKTFKSIDFDNESIDFLGMLTNRW